MSKSIPVFMQNGVDGDISDDMFEKLVQNEMDKYLDKNGPYMDTVINPESVVVDSGFKLDAKYKLINFISLRKDTLVMLSTYTYNKDNKPLTLEEDRAIALSLNSRVQLAPESEYFGTPAVRGIIVGGSGEYLGDVNKPRFPLTIDLLEKSVAFMGASTGKWDKEKLFDRGELNVIKSMGNIQPAFIPEEVKELLWTSNMIYPQPYDRGVWHFPAVQTVYPDDTSVLNSYFVAVAVTYIHKVAYEAQRRYSGNTAMSDAELLAKVDAFMMSKLADAFADMFTVKVKSTLSDFDKVSGFSWTTNVELYANTMRTVMVFSIDALRNS
jgi:hypothetical protein